MKTLRLTLTLITVLAACAQTPVPIPNPPSIPGSALRELVERFTLLRDPAIPSTQTTLTLALSKTPAPNTLLRISFLSSQSGGNFSDAFTPVGPNTKQIVLTLPDYRPFTASDRVNVSYWTLEP